MNFDNIPEELKEVPRWVCWRDTNGRKIPYDAKALNSAASSTNSETWASFDEAETAYEERLNASDAFTGIGFVLSGDGICGVDIDYCIDASGPSKEALQLLEHLGAGYIEISPSGKGLRAFGFAPSLSQGCKGSYDGLNIELYSSERYLTLTGNAIKTDGLREFNGFEALAYAIRTDKRVDKTTGEIKDLAQNSVHAELIRRIVTGEVFHDSLRDLAYSFIGGGLHPGAVVNHLRGIMEAVLTPKDDRWKSRYQQIPDLVSSAQRKLGTIDPFEKNFLKEDEDLFDAMGGIYASKLPNEYTPPDELIEDLLVNKTISILYGDSNSGKTFFAIDMACAISLSRPWFGKQIEGGMVVYLATESPETVKARIQAYQKHHEVLVENLLIIQVPVNFHEGDYDVSRIIQLVRDEERRNNIKCKLIIGDTLARISAGANENSGTDMGPIMARFDFLMNALNTAIMIVHHCGKDAAKGGRGWSGIRAHIDTEIEVTEKNNQRKATITKQRALSSKGDIFYFNLKVIQLGITKFGKNATTCIVEVTEEIDAIKEDEYSWHTSILIDAWENTGKEMSASKPYITRDAVRDSIKNCGKGYAAGTVRNKLMEFDKLVEAERLEPFKAGWRIIDPVLCSYCSILS